MSTLAKPTKLDPFAIPDLKDPVFQEKALVRHKDTRPSARERSNFSGKYSKAWIEDIRDMTKERKVNPYEILAWGIQESNLGNRIKRDGYTPDMLRGGSIFNIQYTPDKTKSRMRNYEDNPYWKDIRKYGPRKASRRDSLRLVVDVLEDKERLANNLYKKRFGRSPTRAEILQGIQGWGTSWHNKAFGGKLSRPGVEYPVHGERILEIAESLRNDPNISKILGK